MEGHIVVREQPSNCREKPFAFFSMGKHDRTTWPAVLVIEEFIELSRP